MYSKIAVLTAVVGHDCPRISSFLIVAPNDSAIARLNNNGAPDYPSVIFCYDPELNGCADSKAQESSSSTGCANPHLAQRKSVAWWDLGYIYAPFHVERSICSHCVRSPALLRRNRTRATLLRWHHPYEPELAIQAEVDDPRLRSSARVATAQARA